MCIRDSPLPKARPQPLLRAEHAHGAARAHERASHIAQHADLRAGKGIERGGQIYRGDIPQSGETRADLVAGAIQQARAEGLQLSLIHISGRSRRR